MLLRFLLLLLLVSGRILAQDDTVHHTIKVMTVISYISEKDFIYGNAPVYGMDTTLSNADKSNPPMDKHYNYLSTNGSAAQEQIYSLNKQLYTGTGNRSYDVYFTPGDGVPYFRTNKRLTVIDYHSGAFKENGITVFHTQNITRNWNAGLFFERMSVKDFMNYSDTYRSRFALNTWYRSPNGRYAVFAHALWNSVQNQVNGGLVSDSLFDNTSVTNLGIKGLAYQISNASQNVKRKTFCVSQYYDLGKSILDTAGKIVGRNTILRMQYKGTFERKSYSYKDIDPDTNFYQNYYYDDTLTFDTLHSDEITNRFALQKPAGAFGKSAFMRNWSQGIFVELQNVKYSQINDTSWNNLSGGANVVWRKDTLSPSLFAEAKYVFSGFDEGNYSVKASVSSSQYAFGQLRVEGSVGLSSPDIFLRMYDGNNFQWRKDFKTIKYLEGTASYRLAKYRFSIALSHYQQDNFVYMNALAVPEQYNYVVRAEQLKLNKDFTWKYWHLDNTFIFQRSGNEVVLHLSDFISENSIYLEKHYFDKALKASTGFRFVYNSSYYANAFMPATGEFYYQNTKKTGGFLRIDLFINAQIKTANIYLKLENAFDGIGATSYYLTPYYPMPGRVFRFGINWKFLD